MQWAYTYEFGFQKGCYLMALRVEDGSALYFSQIVDQFDREASVCQVHGVMIDGQYAYGGCSNTGYGYPIDFTTWLPGGPQLWRGKAFKMDVNTGEVVAEWYSMPEYSNDSATLESELFYR